MKNEIMWHLCDKIVVVIIWIASKVGRLVPLMTNAAEHILDYMETL